MSHLTPERLIEHLSWRAAIKTFDSTRQIPAQTWEALEQAMILAPSSYGMQPWKFFVVSSPATRAILRPHVWNQSQITDASHLVVFACRSNLDESDIDRHISRIAEVRGVPRASLDAFRSRMLASIAGRDAASLASWNANQVYIALGFFLSACAMLGVDACPMEGFDAPKLDGALGLPAKGYNAVVLATAGYRAATDPYSNQAKVRFPVATLIEHV